MRHKHELYRIYSFCKKLLKNNKVENKNLKTILPSSVELVIFFLQSKQRNYEEHEIYLSKIVRTWAFAMREKKTQNFSSVK